MKYLGGTCLRPWATCDTLTCILEGKRPTETPQHVSDFNIKMHRKGVGSGLESSVQDGLQWRDLANRVINFWLP